MSFAAGDNRPWHGDEQAALDVAALLPLATRQIMLAGDGLSALAPTLTQGPQHTVYAWGPASAEDATSHLGLAAFIDWAIEPLPLPPGYLDALVWNAPNQDGADLFAALPRLTPVLHEDGCLLIVLRLTDWTVLHPQLASAGWKVHHAWTHPGPDGHDAPVRIISARKTPYDPRAHAVRLLARGRPDEAHDVLYFLPEHYTPDATDRAAVALESMEYLLAIPQPPDNAGQLERFARAQWLFNTSVPWLQDSPRPYDVFAAFCEELGLSALGARVRRTGGSAVSTPPIKARPAASAPLRSRSTVPVDISRFQRVLFLLGNEPDYGLDVLFDGLCALLGDEKVTAFPYQSSLHEGPSDSPGSHYPCYFQRKSRRPSLEQLCRELQQGAFDLILFGDVSHQLDGSLVRSLLQANRAVPLAIVDQNDSPGDGFAHLCAYLDRTDCRVGFKRERLRGVAYHEKVLPLPFAYPESFISPGDDAPRDRPLAWSGNASVWMRRHYVTRMPPSLGTQPQELQSQQDYVAGLRRCIMAPSFFGAGFDTVRYWEIPAQGALLLAERPPIIVPHNFQDGVHAVFFEDGEDFSAKLDYYLLDKKRCAALALAGHEHLRTYHTGAARARQLLEQVGRAYHDV